MKIFKLVLVVFFVIISNIILAQNKELARERIETLSSKKLHGRGYVKKGGDKAAKYIAGEFKESGLKKFNDSYYQEFTFDVNTFPSKVDISIDGDRLVAGVDYLIGPATPTINDEFALYKPDSVLLNDTIEFKKAIDKNSLNKILVIDYAQTENKDIKMFYIKKMYYNKEFAGIIELIPDELMWAVRTFQNDYPVVKIKRESYPDNAQKIKINVKAKFIKDFEAKNVIAYVEGEKDEFIIFTAHYDHLGHMGSEVYIPGAQDNASGTAMVLDLADHYAKNKPEYSIAFMLFAGEEAGILGSMNYVFHPLVDLKKTKMVINLDMVGTGDDGITIVNGGAEGYEDIWNMFDEINIENEYFTTMKARDEAANSDHYPFHKMGVPAVFIYTMGGETYYHNPKDTPSTLTYTGYDQLFNLVTKFVSRYE